MGEFVLTIGRGVGSEGVSDGGLDVRLYVEVEGRV